MAFEVQLSTTFIRVIAERREFYLSEGGLLFWVFARFSEEGRRLTEDDVFYNNNRNAFVVNEETMDASIHDGRFCLDCYWSVPTAPGPLQHKRIAFGELTLDRSNQRAFYFDYDGARAAEKARQREALLVIDAPLRRQFEGFWIPFTATGTYDRGAWLQLQRAMIRRGISLPAYPKEVSRPLLSALYSARAGKSVGFQFRTFIEVAHRIASGYPGFLRTFRRALDVYDRAGQLIQEDHTGKWRKKVALYKEKLAANDPAYANSDPHQELTALLFPELE